MAPKTPRLTKVLDELGEAYRIALEKAAENPRLLDAEEKRMLRDLLDALQGVREWDGQRLAAKYVLDHGAPEPVSPWHARCQRENAQQAEAERAELERLFRRARTRVA